MRREAERGILAALSNRLKCIALILSELLVSTKNVLVRGSSGDLQQVSAIEPNTFLVGVICYRHESAGGSHKAEDAVTANISRNLYLSAMI